VITNGRQYAISKAQVERVRQTLARSDAAGLHPRAAKAMREGLESQLNDLEQEIVDYEALCSGTVTTIAAESAKFGSVRFQHNAGSMLYPYRVVKATYFASEER
jgi:uncharacterized protein involved in exopolysaccharide biosynthesis